MLRIALVMAGFYIALVFLFGCATPKVEHHDFNLYAQPANALLEASYDP